jgi:hypothetical protein
MENKDIHSTHHLHIPKWADAEKIIREHSKLTQEALDSIGETEPWQCFWAYWVREYVQNPNK